MALIRDARRWNVDDPHRPSVTLLVSARRFLGHLTGTIDVRGVAGSDPFHSIDLTEDPIGRPAVRVASRGKSILLPPFCDFPDGDRSLDLSRAATIFQFRTEGFFGRSLPWWIAIDGDEIVHGEVGDAHERVDGIVEMGYESYLRARSGTTSWRDAIAEHGRVQGGAPELLALASLPQRLRPLAWEAMPAVSEALDVTTHVELGPPVGLEPFEDPASVWPGSDPVRYFRLWAVEMVDGPMLTTLQMWTTSDGGGAIGYEVSSLPFDVPADVVEVPLNGPIRVVWTGRTPFPLTS